MTEKQRSRCFIQKNRSVCPSPPSWVNTNCNNIIIGSSDNSISVVKVAPCQFDITVDSTYFPFTASNGVSILSADVRLGQNVGQIGNPARLLSDREIPMDSHSIILRDVSSNNVLRSNSIALSNSITSHTISASTVNPLTNAISLLTSNSAASCNLILGILGGSPALWGITGSSTDLSMIWNDGFSAPLIGFRMLPTSDLQFTNYPNTRDDGATSMAFYPDINGNLKVGPIIAGEGSVTSFAFIDENGFDGTVLNATSTPTLSLTTSLTPNSVPFIGIGGALNENNTNLNWDNNNLSLTVDNTLRTDIINCLPAGNLFLTLRANNSIPATEVFVNDDGLGVGTFAGGIHTARIKAAGNIESSDAFVLDGTGIIGEFYIEGSAIGLRATTNHDLVFRTNDILRLVIDNGGDLQALTYPSSRDDGATTKALYTDGSGNIKLGSLDLTGAIFANNGLILDSLSSTIQLGQSIGDPLNPAALTSSRQIPMGSNVLFFTGLDNITSDPIQKVFAPYGFQIMRGGTGGDILMDITSGLARFSLTGVSETYIQLINATDNFQIQNLLGKLNIGSTGGNGISIDSLGEIQFTAYFSVRDDGPTAKALYVDASGNVKYGTVTGATLAWSLDGNAGTSPVTNFLGTIDATDLNFRVNNLQSAHIGATDTNTSFGYLALGTNIAPNNTAFGNSALAAIDDVAGANNTGIGANSLLSTTSGNNNTAIGYNSGSGITTGDANILVGINAGDGIITGNNNVIIGSNIAALSATLSNNVIIADGAGNQRIRIDGTGNTGIATTTPAQTLHVQGTARITGNDGTATTIVGRDADGDISAITVGSGLDLTAGILTAIGGGGGSVTDFAFTDGSGFDGTVTNSTTTPTLSLTTTLTTGSIPFIAAAGALSQNNSQFFWDATNNRLGIGTSTPTTKLHVLTSTSEAVTGTFERTVTGTNAINAAIIIRTTSTGDMVNNFGSAISFQIKDNAGIDNSVGVIGAVRSGADNTGDIVISPTTTGTANERMRIMSSGNVGIGTTAPQTLIDIRGSSTTQANFQNTGTFGASSGGFIRFTNSGTPSAADQRLGGMTWQSNPTGTTFRTTASIVGYSEASWTDNVSHPTYLQFNTTTSGSTTNTERMRISSAGNVIIAALAGTGTRVNTSTAAGQLGAIVNGTDGQILTMVSGSPAWANAAGGSGTVTSFVFTDGNGFDGTVSTATTTPTLSLTTTLTTGSVVFIGASGALLQDNANFFWDDTNNRLGLGTSTPAQLLHVAGNARITGSTGTSTTVMGRDGNGDIAAITVGSGLSLVGNTLTASGASFTIGAIDSQSKSANAAVIAGSDLVLQTADASFPGVVSITTQTFAGDKVFEGNVYIDTTHINREKLLIDGDVTGATDMNGISGATALSIAGYTYTDTGAARTVSTLQYRSNFIAPVISSTNAVTYTDVATISISPPVGSGSMTITRPRSINAGGISHLDVIANEVFESSGSVFIGDAGHNIFTGTTATWFLQSLVESRGAVYYIKNAGSGNLTLDAAGSDQIYDTSAAGTLVIPAGASRILVAGTSFWYAE